MTVDWKMVVAVGLGFIVAMLFMKFALPKFGVEMFDENA